MNRMIKSLTALKFLIYLITLILSIFPSLSLKADDQISKVLTLKNRLYKDRIITFYLKHNSNIPIENLHYPDSPLIQISENKKMLNQIYESNNIFSVFDVDRNALVIRKRNGGNLEYRYSLIDENTQKTLYFSQNKLSFTCDGEPPYLYKANNSKYKILSSNLKVEPVKYVRPKKLIMLTKSDSLSLWISKICSRLNNSDIAQGDSILDLIKVNSPILDQNNIVKTTLVTKKARKREKNAFLGIQTTYLKSYYINPYYEKRFGYSISNVYQGSDAFRKGINKNDLILEINGISIDQIVNEYCMNGKLGAMPSEKIIYSKIQHENCQGFLGIRDGKPEIEINNQIQKIIEDDLNNGRKTVLMILKNGDPNGSSSRGCNYRNQYCENIEVELEPTNIDEFMKNYY